MGVDLSLRKSFCYKHFQAKVYYSWGPRISERMCANFRWGKGVSSIYYYATVGLKSKKLDHGGIYFETCSRTSVYSNKGGRQLKIWGGAGPSLRKSWLKMREVEPRGVVISVPLGSTCFFIPLTWLTEVVG